MSFYRTDAGGRPDHAALGQLPPIPGLPPVESLLDPSLLGALPRFALYVPWAAQVDSMTWQEIRSPETSVAAFDLSAILQVVGPLGFGMPGFLAFQSASPLSVDVVERALEGTDYDLFSVQAVYREADPSSPPRIEFLYWARLSDAGAGLSAGSLTRAAASIGARVLYGQQVPRQPGGREPGPFEQAFEAQFPAEGAVVDGAPPPPERPPVDVPPDGGASTQGTSLGGVAAAAGVGLLAAAAAFFAVRAFR